MNILRVNGPTAAQDEAKFMLKSCKFRDIRCPPLVCFESTQSKFETWIIPSDISFYKTGGQIWSNIMVGNSEGFGF